jgi:hypothetical protein
LPKVWRGHNRRASIMGMAVGAVLLLVVAESARAVPLRINIVASPQCLSAPVVVTAVTDVMALLRQGFPGSEVTLNGNNASVRLVLNEPVPIPVARQQLRPYPTLGALDPTFSWVSTRNRDVTTLQLTTRTPEGISCGLYGLLQERLSFRFVHPRQTIFPRHRRWPLPAVFSLTGRPRFEQRGFHLHTQHPIELMDPLLDPTLPDAFHQVMEYLDWLARNGQNVCQFYLLRGVDRTAWPDHARAIVSAAHQRGIRCGVNISLAMIQQQAFQVLTLLRPWRSYDDQVDATLAWLFQAPWDFVTLEATLGEHLPMLQKLLPGAQAHLEQQVQQRYGARLLYATHVIGQEQGERVRRPLLPESGMLIHTVMCYSIAEPEAPVYGNVNQRFMLEAAHAEVGHREVWYWPESSYWVGFDSSVPLLLLPYLDSRHEDLLLMERLGVTGHLTFTSGWEWGYWLVDWSIARWSWRFDGPDQAPSSPLSCLNDLSSDPVLRTGWLTALELQNRYLKRLGLQRYLAALTPFSELPHPLDRPFQPEPEFRYQWLLKEAAPVQVETLLKGDLRLLDEYADRMAVVTTRLSKRLRLLEQEKSVDTLTAKLVVELVTGLDVTGRRARHRALTLRALIAKREETSLTPVRHKESQRLLAQAAAVRQEALEQVKRQEGRYRYPVETIARPRTNLTAYPFGYLYPVAELFFWQREEEQVRTERFDPLFRNLWDFRRTLGLESLFFKQ